ncbi:SnoaL-like domain-containing protein [Aquimarina sp. 2201CG5-10]|uniref:SnoaL-like domain-containing protein n=1 Tax=Aquimarina callyspongiae TaxID=3098150 RepID=UPI002AB4730C|nr:SnoaL-like domain-containing protein [Aquimarina sp. 2201CG5-10]MDY8136326.1 SnoaL-like domain-containing protein [Aquimarina sp. 2201CG5-10]
MNTQEVANRLVELCRLGENMQAVSELYDQNVVSKEMPGMPNEVVSGKDAVIKKSEDWYASVEEFHGGEISDPIVAGNHFTCKMKMDCTFKEQGRMQIEEVNVYKVNNGKIVEEQFFYAMPGQ